MYFFNFIKCLKIIDQKFGIEIMSFRLYTNVCYTEVDRIISLKLPEEDNIKFNYIRIYARDIKKVLGFSKSIMFPHKILNLELDFFDDSLASDIEKARLTTLLFDYILKLRKLSRIFKNLLLINQEDIFKIQYPDFKKSFLQLYLVAEEFEREIPVHLENLHKLIKTL